MKYFVVLFFTLVCLPIFAQETTNSQKVSGIIIDDYTKKPIEGVNIININKVKGSKSDVNGNFEIVVTPSDTLHFSSVGFNPLKMRVTNDWLKTGKVTVQLTQKIIPLDEVIIKPFYLTGVLEVDAKLIPVRENYRYSISGLTAGYEAGSYSPDAFGKVLGSLFNPADLLYNFFGKKPKELKRLREMKKDDTVRKLLESKYDREMIFAMLGVNKTEISEILKRCSYSDSFIENANDLQILDAINGCYEEYRVLKKK